MRTHWRAAFHAACARPHPTLPRAGEGQGGCEAIVVSSPLDEVWNFAPVCISMKQPVP